MCDIGECGYGGGRAEYEDGSPPSAAGSRGRTQAGSGKVSSIKFKDFDKFNLTSRCNFYSHFAL